MTKFLRKARRSEEMLTIIYLPIYHWAEEMKVRPMLRHLNPFRLIFQELHLINKVTKKQIISEMEAHYSQARREADQITMVNRPLSSPRKHLELVVA